MGLASARQDLQVCVMARAPTLWLHCSGMHTSCASVYNSCCCADLPRRRRIPSIVPMHGGPPFARSWPHLLAGWARVQGAHLSAAAQRHMPAAGSATLPSRQCLPPALPPCLHVNACPLPLVSWWQDVYIGAEAAANKQHLDISYPVTYADWLTAVVPTGCWCAVITSINVEEAPPTAFCHPAAHPAAAMGWWRIGRTWGWCGTTALMKCWAWTPRQAAAPSCSQV